MIGSPNMSNSPDVQYKYPRSPNNGVHHENGSSLYYFTGEIEYCIVQFHN